MAVPQTVPASAMMRLRQTTLIVFTIAQGSLAIAPRLAARNISAARLSGRMQQELPPSPAPRMSLQAVAFVNSRELPIGLRVKWSQHAPDLAALISDKLGRIAIDRSSLPWCSSTARAGTCARVVLPRRQPIASIGGLWFTLNLAQPAATAARRSEEHTSEL